MLQMFSDELGELAPALVLAQSKFENAKKSTKNEFFNSRYADLAAVWDSVRKPLSDNGLCVVQSCRNDDGQLVLDTFLLHKSGQWMRSSIPIVAIRKVKKGYGKDAVTLEELSNDPQAVGSALKYYRRYALEAILGIASEDDDAEAAMGRGQHKQQPVSHETKTSAPKPIPVPPEPRVEPPRQSASKSPAPAEKINIDPLILGEYKKTLASSSTIEEMRTIFKSFPPPYRDELKEFSIGQAKSISEKQGA